MADAIRSIIIVSMLAVAVWVFAEAESLSGREVNARVEFAVSPANRDLLRVQIDDAFTGQVQLELRGPRAALDRVQRELDRAITITPATADISTDGPFVIALDDYLQSVDVIEETNVEVISVRPPTLSGELVRLKVVDGVPVLVRTPDIELEAAPTVTPESVRVRLPAATPAEEIDTLAVIAEIDADDVADSPPGEPLSLTAELGLPEPWNLRQDVQLLGPQTAAVGLTIRSTRVVATVEAVLWTTVPSAQAGDFELDVDLGDRVFDVEVAGPAEAVARIETGELPIVAVVAILPDELLESTLSKELRWFVREGGGLRPLPPGIDVRSERQSVTVSITPDDDA